MIIKSIKTTTDNETFATYGIRGFCGNVPYFYEDISMSRSHAEVLDNILSSSEIPEELIDPLVTAYINIINGIDVYK